MRRKVVSELIVMKWQKSKTYALDGLPGDTSKAGCVGDGVQALLSSSRCAGDNGRSKSENALCWKVVVSDDGLKG